MRLPINSQTITPEQLIKIDATIEQAKTSDKPEVLAAGLRLKEKREAIVRGKNGKATKVD